MAHTALLVSFGILALFVLAGVIYMWAYELGQRDAYISTLDAEELRALRAFDRPWREHRDMKVTNALKSNAVAKSVN